MILVGIDMSKNSPGVCINNNDSLLFKSFYRGNPSKKEKQNFDFIESSSDICVYYNKNKRPSKMPYEEQERWNITDAIQSVNNIINNLPDVIDYVAVEGFSYGSKGNAGLDIAGYAYILRQKLVEKYGVDKLYIISPSEIKMNAGKGNAGKDLMLEYFLNKTDDYIVSSSLYINIKNNIINPTEKPIDDIIDAFWIQESLKKKVNGK